MPLARAEALVLDSLPINEQDKLVTLLCREHGVMKALAPGALKVRNRFGAILELFTLAEFFYYWNQERELITLSRGDLLTSHFSLVSRPENVFYFYLLAEITLKFLPHHQHHPRVFNLLLALLKQRDAGVEMASLLLYFAVWMVRIEGLLFNPRRCSSCSAPTGGDAWLRDDFQGVLCRRCRQNESRLLTAAQQEYITISASHPPEELEHFLSPTDLRALIRHFIEKIEFHGEFQLKARRYLGEFA